MRKKILDRPEKIKTSLEELEVLGGLNGSVEWAIIKRLAERYINNLRRISFKLPEDDTLKVRHAGLLGEALGIRNLIRLVEKAQERLEKEK